MLIVPVSGSISLFIILSRVVLPEPEAPTRATNEPAPILNETPPHSPTPALVERLGYPVEFDQRFVALRTVALWCCRQVGCRYRRRPPSPSLHVVLPSPSQ